MLSPDNTLHPASSDPTDLQLSMSFWADRDPNLKRVPVISFAVDAGMLGGLLNVLALPHRPSDRVALHIGKNTLCARVSDLTGATWIEGSIPLESEVTADCSGLTIATDRQLLTRLGNILRGKWSFRFDRTAEELSWTNDNYRSQCNAVELIRPVARRASVSYQVSGKLLGKCLRDATTMRQRRLSLESGYHGARVCGGFAMGGYMRGVSQVISPEIPLAIDFAIPHLQLSNAVHILKAMEGCSSLAIEDDVVIVESKLNELKGGWSSKEANWPKELAGIFNQHEPLVSLYSSADKFCGKSALFAAFPKHLRTVCFDLEKIDSDSQAKLAMTGVFGNLPWQSKFAARVRLLASDFAQKLQNMHFEVSDLAKAAVSLAANAEIELQFSERGLPMQVDKSGTTWKIFLPGISIR
jgi:hypothetical protein